MLAMRRRILGVPAGAVVTGAVCLVALDWATRRPWTERQAQPTQRPEVSDWGWKIRVRRLLGFRGLAAPELFLFFFRQLLVFLPLFSDFLAFFRRQTASVIRIFSGPGCVLPESACSSLSGASGCVAAPRASFLDNPWPRPAAFCAEWPTCCPIRRERGQGFASARRSARPMRLPGFLGRNRDALCQQAKGENYCCCEPSSHVSNPLSIKAWIGKSWASRWASISDTSFTSRVFCQ